MAKVTFIETGVYLDPPVVTYFLQQDHSFQAFPRHQHQLLTKHLNAGDWVGGISFNPDNQALGLLYKGALI